MHFSTLLRTRFVSWTTPSHLDYHHPGWSAVRRAAALRENLSRISTSVGLPQAGAGPATRYFHLFALWLSPLRSIMSRMGAPAQACSHRSGTPDCSRWNCTASFWVASILLLHAWWALLTLNFSTDSTALDFCRINIPFLSRAINFINYLFFSPKI